VKFIADASKIALRSLGGFLKVAMVMLISLPGLAVSIGRKCWVPGWGALIILLTFTFSKTAISHATDCTFHDVTVPDGGMITAYKEAFVPFGTSCQSQQRTCTNGHWDGGYYFPSCESVPFVNSMDRTPVKRSDVLMTVRLKKHYNYKDWKTPFTEFGATRMVWTYAGWDLLQDPWLRDREIPVQCALEYWVPSTATISATLRDEMSCLKKTITGEPDGFATHPTYSLRIPDVNTTAWRDYILGKSKELIFLGARSFVQDVPGIMAVTRNTRSFINDGCHSTESEIKFEAYKTENPSASYADFMKYSVSEYHDWLHKELILYAKSLDPDTTIRFSANTSARVSAHLVEDQWFFPYFDNLAAEVFGDQTDNKPGPTVDEMLRFLDAKDSELEPTLLTLRANTDPNRHDVMPLIPYLRRAAMSTYALGMVPFLPWGSIPLTEDSLNYYYGNLEDYSDIYHFVQSKKSSFDNFSPALTSDVIKPGNLDNIANTLHVSTSGFLVVSRKHVGALPPVINQSIHIVNWTGTSSPLELRISKTAYQRRPNFIWKLGDSQPTRIEAESDGSNYKYSLGEIPEWAIIYYVYIDATSPEVTLTTPTAGTIYTTPQSVPVKATATDEVEVAKVWLSAKQRGGLHRHGVALRIQLAHHRGEQPRPPSGHIRGKRRPLTPWGIVPPQCRCR
jgi:hypothetical protein